MLAKTVCNIRNVLDTSQHQADKLAKGVNTCQASEGKAHDSPGIWIRYRYILSDQASVQGCTSGGLVNHHSEIQLSKRAGAWIAYISVGSVGYNEVVIVNRVKLCHGK
jgi:hypothetical protein